MLRRALFGLAVCFWAGLAMAQEAPDIGAFATFAAEVEADIQKPELADADLEALRAELADWRKRFLAAGEVNAVQIDALEAQIAALGPAPAEGATEPREIAERRAELARALDEARAPRVAVVEAHARADALIGRIDATLRSRQADAFLELRRTPLDPSLWAGAAARLAAITGSVRGEITDNLAAISERDQLWQRIVIALVLLVAAVLLILRGPGLVERVLARIETRAGDHGRILYGFLVSFGGVMAAVAGVSLMNAALISTGILGETGRDVALGINAAVLTYAIGRWLGGRIFPEREAIPTPLVLDARRRAQGRILSEVTGAIFGLVLLLGILGGGERIAADEMSVIAYPVLVLLGIALFRLGRLVRRGGHAPEGGQPGHGDRIERLVGGTVQTVGLIGPLAATIGLMNLAGETLMPAASSLALLAFLASLHYAIRAAYAMLRGLSEEAAAQALTPVLVSFVLTLTAAPFLALIWGARSSDLGEVWARFVTGFRVGGTTISPVDFLTFLVVFGVGFGLTRLVQGTLRSGVLPRTRIDKGSQNAIVSGLGYLGVTVAVLAGITAAGIDLSSFALVIGALGVGIGFGLQNIVNNFVSGIILLIERPIGEGDWVEVGGQMGIVKAISVRSTRIETFDRTDVIVPNGDLISGTVTNWTRGNSIGRVIVPVGVAYGTDTRKVEAILMTIAEAHPIVAMDPPPAVYFIGFGADSMDFEIRAILTDINFSMNVKSDMNHEIARRFAEEGIEIPFAQRDVWLRNPEALAPGAAKEAE